MRPHYNLNVWKEAIELVKETYDVTRLFPKEERYLLANQMRRAAVSVPSNIAEGAARNGSREFLRFLYISRGSLCELETQLLIAKQLSYTRDITRIMNKVNTVFALTNGLIRNLRIKISNDK